MPRQALLKMIDDNHHFAALRRLYHYAPFGDSGDMCN
jgi:hypothetical protein